MLSLLSRRVFRREEDDPRNKFRRASFADFIEERGPPPAGLLLSSSVVDDLVCSVQQEALKEMFSRGALLMSAGGAPKSEVRLRLRTTTPAPETCCGLVAVPPLSLRRKELDLLLCSFPPLEGFFSFFSIAEGELWFRAMELKGFERGSYTVAPRRSCRSNSTPAPELFREGDTCFSIFSTSSWGE